MGGIHPSIPPGFTPLGVTMAILKYPPPPLSVAYTLLI